MQESRDLSHLVYVALQAQWLRRHRHRHRLPWHYAFSAWKGGEVSLSPSSAISAIYVFFSDPNSNLDKTSPRGGPDFVAIELM